MKTKLSTLLLIFALCSTLFWGCEPTGKAPKNEQGKIDPEEEGGGKPEPSGKMLLISDIHFNPFYDVSIVSQLINADVTQWEAIFNQAKDSSYGVYKEDTYYPLFKSFLEQMPQIEATPDVIIITGDFISHNFEEVYTSATGVSNIDSIQSFIRKTESYITAQLAKKYPNTPILPVLGNNDGFCGDYHIEAQGGFLKFFSKLWKPRLQEVYHADDFENTFSKGGYYAVAMPWDSTQIFIGLNTVLFSPSHYSDKHTDYCSKTIPSPEAGNQQLAWLKETLSQCKKQNKKVWMAYHIPPGIDVYGSKKCSYTSTMWEESFNDSFIELVKQYKSTIVANFAGHTHMDDFRVFEENGTPISYIHITPSISPINGNNPAIQHVTWNPKDMTLENNITHYFKGIATTGDNQWKPEYNFNEAYGEKGINPQSLNNIIQNVYSDEDAAREKYLQFYEVDKTHTVPKDWMAYWCGLNKLTKADFRDCYCNKKTAKQ